MDYEQKYNEALERVRRLHDRMLVLSSTDALVASSELEFIFPELTESEDERIRRKMIEHFKAKTKETWCNMPVKDIIAYLEKQKVFSNGEGLYYYRPDGNYTFIGTGLGPVEDIKLNGERPKTENNSVDLPGACCVEKQKEPHKRLRDKTPWIVTAKEELAHAEERLQANLEELHRIRAEKEKQKEKKPAEPSDDELQRHQDELYDFKVFAAKQAKEHHISFVHDFEWNNFCAELLSYFNEQKPVSNPKWAELTWKDINELERIINNVHYEFQNGIGEDSFGELVLERFKEYKDDGSMDEQKPADYNEYKMLMDGATEDGKIKGRKEVIDHPEKYGLTKQKPEWSEEENQLIGFIFDLLNDLVWRKDWAMSKEECLERLKSLRPSWKPSEMNTNCEGCLYWTGKCKLPKGLDCPEKKEEQK